MIVSIGCEGDSSADGSEPVGGDAMPDTAGASIGQGGSTIANMPSAAGTSGSREGGQPAFGGFDSLLKLDAWLLGAALRAGCLHQGPECQHEAAQRRSVVWR